MDIQKWMQERINPESLDAMALRIWKSGRPYARVEGKLRQRYILEALVANGGHQGKAAEQLRISRKTVTRAVEMMGLTAKEIRGLAKTMNGEAK